MIKRVSTIGRGGAHKWSFLAKRNAELFEMTVADRTAAVADEFTDVDLTKHEDGTDLLQPGAWDVRFQGARGTCNAFAAVAAAELFDFHRGGSSAFTPFSEEYLYARTQSIDVQSLGMDPGDEGYDNFEESGATFLGQVRLAIEQGGNCRRDLVKYDPDKEKNFRIRMEDLPADATADAAQPGRKVAKEDFHYGITAEPEIGTGKVWEEGGENGAVAALFARLLKQKIPIVASFAILGRKKKMWDGGRLPKKWGEIEYPKESIANTLTPTGAHAVCLVGMIKKEVGGTADNPGWFLFRNSYGTDRFARLQHKDKTEPIALEKGYGTISAYDVDRYCWEYLARKP